MERQTLSECLLFSCSCCEKIHEAAWLDNASSVPGSPTALIAVMSIIVQVEEAQMKAMLGRGP